MITSRDCLGPKDRRTFDSIVDGLMWHGWTRERAEAQTASIFTPSEPLQ